MNVGCVPLPKGLLFTCNDIIDVQYSTHDPGQRDGDRKTKTFLAAVEMQHSLMELSLAYRATEAI